MLSLSGELFTTSRARYFDRDPTRPGDDPKIYVSVVPGALQASVLAQVDTGAPWCVFHPEIVEALGLLDDSASLGTITISTRFGQKTGHLVRLDMTLVADQGTSLVVEGTVFACPDWEGGNFLGYRGLLQSVRTGFDPQNNVLYFGGY